MICFIKRNLFRLIFLGAIAIVPFALSGNLNAGSSISENNLIAEGHHGGHEGHHEGGHHEGGHHEGGHHDWDGGHHWDNDRNGYWGGYYGGYPYYNSYSNYGYPYNTYYNSYSTPYYYDTQYYYPYDTYYNSYPYYYNTYPSYGVGGSGLYLNFGF